MKTQSWIFTGLFAVSVLSGAVAHADNCQLKAIFRPLGDGPSPLSQMRPLFPNAYPYAITRASAGECIAAAKDVLKQTPDAVITLDADAAIVSVRYQYTDAEGFRISGKVKAPKN
jgi:hypothetical protein